MARKASSKPADAHLGFEAKLSLAADKLCNNREGTAYKRVILPQCNMFDSEDDAGLFDGEIVSI